MSARLRIGLLVVVVLCVIGYTVYLATYIPADLREFVKECEAQGGKPTLSAYNAYCVGRKP